MGTLSRWGRFIAPPLHAFAFQAVGVHVTRIGVGNSRNLLPGAVRGVVVATGASNRFYVVTHFAVFRSVGFSAFERGGVGLVSVRPT